MWPFCSLAVVGFAQEKVSAGGFPSPQVQPGEWRRANTHTHTHTPGIQAVADGGEIPAVARKILAECAAWGRGGEQGGEEALPLFQPPIASVACEAA